MMPILSRKYEYLFLMPPGTGCRAVGERVLIPQFDGEFFPSQFILDDDGGVLVHFGHATSDELIRHGLLRDEELAQLFKFTTVRNPFDWLVTHYTRLRTIYGKMLEDPEAYEERHPEIRNPRMVRSIQLSLRYPFDDWIDHRFQSRRARKRLHRGPKRYKKPKGLFVDYVRGADFVMRFERLEEDLNEVLRRVGAGDGGVELPRFNVTQARERDYRGYYTPKAREIVEYAYGPELERFGYSF
jgi:hypothetical protein